ncbi:MAG: hypothetical protein ABI433_06975 [Burkholderiaceae bacterium]
MIDRYFTAALTFALLVGGTLAIGSALFGMDRPGAPKAAAQAHAVVQLPTVVITAKRLPAASAVASSDTAEPGAPRVQ